MLMDLFEGITLLWSHTIALLLNVFYISTKLLKWTKLVILQCSLQVHVSMANHVESLLVEELTMTLRV